MFEIRIYNHKLGEFEDIKFNKEDVVRFGIINKKLWNRNRTFKKFDKRAFIETKEHNYMSYNTDIIKELKVALKGNYTSRKSEQYEFKNYNERKAIDWIYEIIK